VHLPIILFVSIALAYLLGKGEQTLLAVTNVSDDRGAIDVAVYVIYLTTYTPYIQRLLKIVSYGAILRPRMACRRLREGGCGSAVGFDRRRALAYGLCAILIVVPFTHIYRDLSLWQQVTNDTEPDSSDAHRKRTKTYSTNNRKFSNVSCGRDPAVGGHRHFSSVSVVTPIRCLHEEINAVSRLFQERFRAHAVKTIRCGQSKTLATIMPVAERTATCMQRVAESFDCHQTDSLRVCRSALNRRSRH